MPRPPSPATRPLPGWVMWVGSAVVGFHLFAILIHVLAAPSGPWMMRFGPSQALGPQFTQAPNEQLTQSYLLPLKMTTVTIWEPSDAGGVLRLRTVAERDIPANRPVERPSELSLVLARSYMRYLCRKHGAASAELIRHTRPAILSGIVFVDPLPPDTFEDLACSFGEHKVEK